jgi:hypothetical protein
MWNIPKFAKLRVGSHTICIKECKPLAFFEATAEGNQWWKKKEYDRLQSQEYVHKED